MMRDDPAINAVRDARCRVSETVGHDPRKLVKRYRRLQLRLDSSLPQRVSGTKNATRQFSTVIRGSLVVIPPFDDNGYLPAGLYPATIEEVDARFGRESELRRVQLESLRWLVDLVRRAGVERLVINGSFVTDVFEPNDVDCALLIGEGFPRDKEAEAELLAGLPFLELSLVNQADFELLVNRFFSTDRQTVAKGMVEIVL